MIRRPPRSTRLNSSAASDVYKRQPPIGGDERMQFMKQAELDYQDYMIISDSEFEITDEYLIFKYKLDN